MAKMYFKGMDVYEKKLSAIAAGSRAIAGKALYAGAKIAADEMRKEILALKVSPSSYATPGHPSDSINPVQQQGLLDGLGIAPIQEENGYIHVKVGIDGYNGLKTTAHPKGQPNAEVARSIQSGTSYMQKQPFVTNAMRKCKSAAEQAIKDVIDQEIEKIEKG